MMVDDVMHVSAVLVYFRSTLKVAKFEKYIFNTISIIIHDQTFEEETFKNQDHGS